jgi:hypothetical protein
LPFFHRRHHFILFEPLTQKDIDLKITDNPKIAP